jgi:hypothetical protein
MFSNTAVRTSHIASSDKLLLVTYMNENSPLSRSAILKIFSVFSLVFLVSESAKEVHELYVKLQFRPELCSSLITGLEGSMRLRLPDFKTFGI